MRRTHRNTTTRRAGFFDRLRPRRKQTVTTTTTTTTETRRTRNARHSHNAAPVHHQRRRASMGDKISGAFMKLEGTLTRRPGLKVSNSPTRRPNRNC